MLAVMRPHSSKLAEFISSWMPFGWKGICILAGRSRQGVELERVAWLLPSAIRAYPSHLAVGLVGLLHQPLATKLVP